MMLPNWRAALCLHFLSCWLPDLARGDVVLVERGAFVADYDAKIQAVEEGSVLALEVEAGRWIKIEVKRVIAGFDRRVGTMSLLVETAAGRVARLPITNKLRPILFASKFMEAAAQLREFQGQQVVRVYAEESFAPFVIISELIDLQFTLDDYSAAYNEAMEERNLPPIELQVRGHEVSAIAANSGLLAFFDATSHLGHCEDFSERQIGLAGSRGWVWFDLYPTDAAEAVEDGSLLTPSLYLPKGLRHEVSHTIEQRRLQLGWRRSKCSDAWDLTDEIGWFD